jgi:hypothetical protein
MLSRPQLHLIARIALPVIILLTAEALALATTIITGALARLALTATVAAAAGTVVAAVSVHQIRAALAARGDEFG